MPMQLYTIDQDGEYWLDNPQLIIGNPRRSKKMAARKNRRRGTRRYTRRRARRNPGLMLNPRRRRRTYRRRARRNPARVRHYAAARNPRRRRARISRRRYRRNPSLGGFTLPPMDAVLYTAAGFIVPPMVQSFVMRFIPAAYQANQGVQWAVKAASAIVPPMLVKKFVSQRAGNLMLLGGVVSLAIDAVRTFAPGVIPGLSGQPFLGRYYNMNNQPGMGKYIDRGGQRRALAGPGGGGQMAQIFQGVPERLQASNRF